MNLGDQITMDSVLAKNMEEKMSPPKEKKSVPHLDKLIINAVISKLGKPSNLFKVSAKNLWSNRWRVDVWCTHQVETECMAVENYKIDYSYFIKYDEDSGTIVSCNPEIEPIKDLKNERIQKRHQ